VFKKATKKSDDISVHAQCVNSPSQRVHE